MQRKIEFIRLARNIVSWWNNFVAGSDRHRSGGKRSPKPREAVGRNERKTGSSRGLTPRKKRGRERGASAVQTPTSIIRANRQLLSTPFQFRLGTDGHTVKPAGDGTQSPQSVCDCTLWRHLFPPRREQFVPQVHLAGRFGGEGVPARVSARQRILSGLKFEWSDKGVCEPLLSDVEALLEEILSRRLRWYREQNIESRPSELRKQVVNSAPAFILQELLRNAFDAHAHANREGPISLCGYVSKNGTLVLDVSDDGIGIKSVHHGSNLWGVYHHEVARNWHPVIEGELGVGLMWSKFLAETHDGMLEFLKDVYPRQKTTVRVSFPHGVLRVLET